MMHRLRLIILVVLLVSYGFAQETSLIRPFGGGRFVSSVTMNGTAVWHQASDQQTGTALLQASATGQSRMELHLEKGTRIETQNAFNEAGPHCTWSGFDGVEHETAPHKCLRSTVWFLPEITTQDGANATEIVAAQHGDSMHYERRVGKDNSKEVAALIQRFSSSELHLNSETGLPDSLHFTIYPEDSNASQKSQSQPLIHPGNKPGTQLHSTTGHGLEVEVRYSDYRPVDGVAIPFRIQKFINQDLVLDLTIENAQINFSGL